MNSVTAGFLDRTLDDNGVTRAYQVYVPEGYTPDRRWPVVLFLHGGGEAGWDGRRPTEVGLGPALRAQAARWPALVVFPQVRPGHRWNGADAALALRTLAATQREFALDEARVYLTGLSRGGVGAWYLAYRDPARFAAALIICSRVTPTATLDDRPAPDLDPVVPAPERDPFTALAERLKGLPLWVFHGDADPIMPVEEARRAVRALQNAGAPVRYTELAGVGHGAWDAAYGDAEVAAWLLAQRRP